MSAVTTACSRASVLGSRSSIKRGLTPFVERGSGRSRRVSSARRAPCAWPSSLARPASGPWAAGSTRSASSAMTRSGTAIRANRARSTTAHTTVPSALTARLLGQWPGQIRYAERDRLPAQAVDRDLDRPCRRDRSGELNALGADRGKPRGAIEQLGVPRPAGRATAPRTRRGRSRRTAENTRCRRGRCRAKRTRRLAAGRRHAPRLPRGQHDPHAHAAGTPGQGGASLRRLDHHLDARVQLLDPGRAIAPASASSEPERRLRAERDHDLADLPVVDRVESRSERDGRGEDQPERSRLTRNRLVPRRSAAGARGCPRTRGLEQRRDPSRAGLHVHGR